MADLAKLALALTCATVLGVMLVLLNETQRPETVSGHARTLGQGEEVPTVPEVSAPTQEQTAAVIPDARDGRAPLERSAVRNERVTSRLRCRVEQVKAGMVARERGRESDSRTPCLATADVGDDVGTWDLLVFSGASLVGADLRCADLAGANFSSADLRGPICDGRH